MTLSDEEFIEKIKTLSFHFHIKTPERLPLGSKSRGRFIDSKETGGMSILVPSFGALEKEEVDYVAEEAIYREKERQKKAEPRLTKVALQNVVAKTLKAPKGKRKELLEKITKEGLR